MDRRGDSMQSRRLSALTFGFIVSTALSSAALAQGSVTYDWSGFYIGAHAGYGWVDLNGSHETESAGPNGELENFAGSFDFDDDDLLGGFQLGFNYQIDNLVLGVEGDLSLTGFKDEVANSIGSERVSFDTDLLMTLRARAGLAVDNLLFYATAGAAWSDTTYELEDLNSNPVQNGDIDVDDIGFVVGGGAEYAVNEDWSITAEALYYIFDDKQDTQDLTTDSEIGDFIELEDIFVIRVGVNFHL